MEIRILGPLEAWDGEEPVDTGGPKQRRVLAALALQPGRVVPVEQLVDAVWADRPPATARRQVQNAVSALRQTAIGTVLGASGPGYVLRMSRAQVDACRFEDYLAEAGAARRAGELAGALETVRRGLALWRGPALAGVGGRTAEVAGTYLQEQRLSAATLWAELLLELDRPADVIDTLIGLVEQNPIREPLTALLMLALYRCGRGAESLVWYHRAREALDTQLGIEPGKELQRLFERLLAVDPGLDHHDSARAGARNDLPRDIAEFTGRAAELDRLTSLVDQPGVVVIQAIDGMAGVGKTTLAVHAAHRLADRFPDGQLFVDLHGHTVGRERLTAEVALEVLLRAVGVRTEAIPKDLDEKAARWRAELAGRRALVVLDNALSPAQIRPLLPGSARCAVLVTSRRRLVGLEGVEVLSLNTLPRPDALALFGRIVGAGRADAEPEAAVEVVRLCGDLPLAIGIVAGWLRARPMWTVEHLAERLAGEGRRMALMRTDDYGVAAAFALSYQHLPPDQQSLFRLLGLYPGTDIDTYAAAALAGVSVGEAGHLLDALCDAHLLTQYRPDRYRLHDLAREYARMCADADEPDSRRTLARERLLDYFLEVTEIAADLLVPGRRRLGPRPAQPPVAIPLMSRQSDAAAWFEAELGNLPAVARFAAGHGKAGHGWQIPRNIAAYAGRYGHYPTGIEVLRVAVTAWRPGDDPVGQSVNLSNLALMHMGLGQYEPALDCLSQGLAIARDAGDRASQGSLLTRMADLNNRMGRYGDGIAFATDGMAIYRERGDLNNGIAALGVRMDALVRLGRPDEAVAIAASVVEIPEALKGTRAEGVLLSRLGTAHSHLNDHHTAVDLLTRAIEIIREVKDRPSEAAYLHRLANALHRSGRYHDAQTRAHEALAIINDLVEPTDLAETHNVLGTVSNDLRRHRHALTHHRQALAAAAEVGYRFGEAKAHQGIGDALSALGEHDQARHHRQQALSLFTAVGVPDAERMRRNLGLPVEPDPAD